MPLKRARSPLNLYRHLVQNPWIGGRLWMPLLGLVLVIPPPQLLLMLLLLLVRVRLPLGFLNGGLLT